MSSENPLDPVEQLLADDRLMAPGVELAVVLDLSEVVAVGEHSVYLRLAERFGSIAGSRTATQPASGKQRRDIGDRVEAGVVGLIAPADHRRALLINDDGADLTTLGQRLTHVEVADCGAAVGATDFDLAADAAADLL
ncbi:MAG TPA: hypothetical protein VL988_06280 [Solirubrobacteraceae bacterium]|nr:hypothetical protein [Solirubrobacteraceae bacterium]